MAWEYHLEPTVLTPSFPPMTGEALIPPAWYFEQELWVENPSAPGNAAHNYPIAMRLRGPLKYEVLERSIQELFQRHRVLRSAFRKQHEQLTQIILPPAPITIAVSDLTESPDDIRKEKVTKTLREEARQPFELAQGPMLRVRLVRLGTEDHILCMTTHHIVSDHWSTVVLVRDLFTLYTNFNAGKPSSLTDLPMQYSGYVNWLAERLEGEKLAIRLRFWAEHLAARKSFHHLSPDHVPPTTRSYRGTHERAELSEQLTNSIKLISQQERVSPFMVLLAALQCLLQRYSGDEDIGVGSCVGNRPLLELENVVGPFANVAIFRTSLAANPSFREVLRRVREMSLTTYSYEDTPFGTLVKHFAQNSPPGRHPLFQVLLVLLNAVGESWNLPGLAVEPIAIDTGYSCFELNFNVKIGARVYIDLQYATDLFQLATIRSLLKDYGVVLSTVVGQPDLRLGELETSKVSPGSEHKQPAERFSGGPLTPRTRTESRLLELWETAFGKHPIGLNDDFFELGGDSVRAARLFTRICQEFSLNLPLGTLLQASTIAKIAKIIDSRVSEDIRDCLVPLRPGSRLPLFCVHGQSGSVLMYRGLAQHLGPDRPVYGIQPPLTNHAQSALTIEEMAAIYAKAITAVQPQGPYFLTGYCMGGTISLEIAQQLRRRGQIIGLLALLDTYNWNRIRNTSFGDTFYWAAQRCWFACMHFNSSYEKKWTWLQRRLRDIRSPSPVSEGNRQAALNYVPSKYPGPILHISPSKQFARYKRLELGWNQLAAHVEKICLPVYPEQMLEEPFVADLAEVLRAKLEADGREQTAS